MAQNGFLVVSRNDQFGEGAQRILALELAAGDAGHQTHARRRIAKQDRYSIVGIKAKLACPAGGLGTQFITVVGTQNRKQVPIPVLKLTQSPQTVQSREKLGLAIRCQDAQGLDLTTGDKCKLRLLADSAIGVAKKCKQFNNGLLVEAFGQDRLYLDHLLRIGACLQGPQLAHPATRPPEGEIEASIRSKSRR